MKVICDYCESYIEATDEKCPNCGAPNTHFVRTASDTPKTIEQLLDFCARRNLPLEKMHVHVGEDYRSPKAFGIYKDEGTGHFIVYKNKESGVRAVRYEGTDEAYAVNEIYMKIKDLVMDAREHSVKTPENEPVSREIPSPVKHNKGARRVTLVLLGLIAALMLVGLGLGKIGKTSYYDSGNYSDSSISGSEEYSSDDSGNWFTDWIGGIVSDWDTDDDWDSGTDWNWSDSYDSYDYSSSTDWDSDW